MQAFEEALSRWIASRVPDGPEKLISLDGKTARGSRAGDVPGQHLVAAYCAAARAVLAQVKVDAKTNEHKAALQLLGIVATIWCQLRGWPKDQQRAVFQPVGVATFAMTAAWLGGQGAIPREVWWLFVVALPVLLVGTWLGLKLYGRLDEAQFRRVVLVLLLASGVVLLFR